ncbi:MAG TPA: aa3-type cytochrome c oxidase subunit IV [Stellaceae bacterium]|jgi:hypothetical protein|nr:aa3-type cytochrome c oxidase subunit IV [Stellaceae bacterium]
MSLDQDLLSHRATWLGFARLLRWSVTGIIVVLVGMALFLV